MKIKIRGLQENRHTRDGYVCFFVFYKVGRSPFFLSICFVARAVLNQYASLGDGGNNICAVLFFASRQFHIQRGLFGNHVLWWQGIQRQSQYVVDTGIAGTHIEALHDGKHLVYHQIFHNVFCVEGISLCRIFEGISSNGFCPFPIGRFCDIFRCAGFR